MSVSSVHVYLSGATQLDLRQIVAVADTQDANVVTVFFVGGSQEGLRVPRVSFTSAYQASLNAS